MGKSVGKLLSFPHRDITVIRTCDVCGVTGPVHLENADKEEMICIDCYLWADSTLFVLRLKETQRNA